MRFLASFEKLKHLTALGSCSHRAQSVGVEEGLLSLMRHVLLQFATVPTAPYYPMLRASS